MTRLKQHKISLALILLAILLAAGSVHAQPLETITNERKQVEKEIQSIDKLLKSIDGNQKSGLQQLTLIKKKIDSRKQVLSTIDKQINLLSTELDRKQLAITILQADLESVKNSYSDLLIRYYSIRNKDNWMMYIMASESVSQAYKRMKYFREILLLLQSQADKIVSMTNRLNGEITDMARKQQLLQDNIGDKHKEVGMLETEQKQSQTVLSDLKRREQDLRKQLNEKKLKDEQLTASLRDFFRSDAGKNIDISTSDQRLLTEHFEASKGFLPWPVMGTVVSNFGKHKHAVHKDIDLPENNGIDIQTPNNAEVYSVFGGKVSSVLKIPKTGEKAVIVMHGGYYSIYFRLEDVFVKPGEEVKLRQKIATVASTTEGSILHFEIQKLASTGNAAPTPQNPEKWIIK